MKKLIFTLFILLSLGLSQAQACGGCRDAFLSSQNANEGKSNYDDGEKTIANSIDKLNAIIKDEINFNEDNVLKEKAILVALKKDEALRFKQSSFLLQKQNELLNLISGIEAF